MHFLPNKLALACAIALSLAACNDNSSNAPADPAATKASLMQTMDEALREGQALDPYGFAIDAASIAKRKALDSSLLKRLDALDSSVLSERDRLFYDMIRWDLQINLAGYDLPQSQIPIHHFRNRVVDLADEVGAAPASGRAARMQDGDALIFMNFRADRAREITRAFVDSDFTGFARTATPALNFVMLTEYAADIKTACAYPPTALVNTLGEWLAKQGKTQLRISETEKYAHVTFFFNGGEEACFTGEDREIVASPKVATYDLQPEMSSEELTDKLVGAIKSGKYDVIICNYPNGDMVGHTGVFDAAVKACEAVDHCIGRVTDALAEVGGECLITADHGNAEKMMDEETGQAHTAHTNLPVPLIYFGRKAEVAEGGKLSDLAPTMLTLMGLPVPPEMTGKPLMILK